MMYRSESGAAGLPGELRGISKPIRENGMSTAFRRVAVVAKATSREALRTAFELSEWLSERDLQVLLDEAALRSKGGEEEQLFRPEEPVDLVIVLGGDGTLLSAARSLPSSVPILGVNMGRLGFLTEVGRSELYPSLEAVLANGYRTERRSFLDVALHRAGGSAISYRVLNDAVIAKSALARIFELTVTVDGHLVGTYRSDGLIVSTPTGSTAYNLSAGGPILSPTLPVAVITPICPHTLSLRPLVVPDSSRIEVTLETPREEVYLTLDGQEGTSLSYRDRISITRSEAAARLVKVAGRTFYESLRGKLSWGG
jgi:NAD+ kinase